MEQGAQASRMGTSEARKALPELVKEAAGRRRPAKSPKANAVEISTRGQRGSASLVPTVDLDAAEARIGELEREREVLEEDLEDAGIALLLQERMASTSGERVSAAEFLEGIGMGEFGAELPGA
jgi:hypothetical protein